LLFPVLKDELDRLGDERAAEAAVDLVQPPLTRAEGGDLRV
jgi:hypothetical protein